MNRVAAALASILALSSGAWAAEGPSPDHGPRPYFPPAFFKGPTFCEPYGGGPKALTQVPVIFPEAADVYPSIWRAAGEPSLYDEGQEKLSTATVYRFTWLRAFEVPIVVRIDVRPFGRMQMTAYRMSGKGDAGPGKAERIVRPLTNEEARSVRRAFEGTRLFNRPAITCPNFATDGSYWVFEARGRLGPRQPGYFFLERWTPGDGPVRDAGLLLLKLTGWPLDPLY